MITQKLINLTNAMIEFEGWLPSGQGKLFNDPPSVSYRNHNPGNLRSSIFALGTRDGFAYFYNDITGIFAMRFDIMQKCKGRTVTDLTPDSTVRDLIKVYSAEDGATLQNYVDFVTRRTGLLPTTPIGYLIDIRKK